MMLTHTITESMIWPDSAVLLNIRAEIEKKRTFEHVHLAKIQISRLHNPMGMFIEQSLASQSYFIHVDNEDSDRTARMHRLIR